MDPALLNWLLPIIVGVVVYLGAHWMTKQPITLGGLLDAAHLKQQQEQQVQEFVAGQVESHLDHPALAPKLVARLAQRGIKLAANSQSPSATA